MKVSLEGLTDNKSTTKSVFNNKGGGSGVMSVRLMSPWSGFSCLLSLAVLALLLGSTYYSTAVALNLPNSVTL